VVNEEDEVLGFNKRLLIGSTDLSVNRIVELIHQYRGIAIASHIDREGFGIIGQLGFIPPEVSFDGLEISSSIGIDDARNTFSPYMSFPWITSSDAHELQDIGRKTTGFFMNHATFDELRLTLGSVDNRRIML